MRECACKSTYGKKVWKKIIFKQVYCYKLLFKKTSMLTFSGLRFPLNGLTIWPLELKSRSEGEIVAHTDKYFLASLFSKGKTLQLCRHHVRVSTSISILGVLR